MAEAGTAALIVGLVGAATQGAIEINRAQGANQDREEALKAAKQSADAQKKLISDAQAKEAADKATAVSEGQLANVKKRQGAAAISSRYSGGEGTATLLGGAGVPVGSSGKTLLGM